MITKEKFGNYDKYEISKGDLAVTVTTLGATCISIKFKGKELALTHKTADEYLNGDGFIGAIVGRYANRIKDAKFTLNGKEYILPANEGKNQLHGGPNAFDKRTFKAEEIGDNAVKFTYFSPDGENGYPGNLTAVFTYTVENDAFKIDFEGDTDADTVYAPTTHLYFNLAGGGSILDHEARVLADEYVAVDDESIPTEIKPVDEYFDFRKTRKIKSFIDHSYVLNKSEGDKVCEVSYDGVKMTLEADAPGVQFYTGKFLSGEYKAFEGFAFEPGLYPNSPNRDDFPNATLKAGEHYHKYARFSFESI